MNERHAIGVDPAAPARVDEVRAHDRERERRDEAAQRRIICKLRLREDGLARRQQPQRLAVHQAGLVIEHEAHELPRAFLVAAALERGERLGEIKGGALVCRTERQRHRSKVASAYILLLLADRARIVLVHAGNAASESLDDLDEAIGCSAGRRDLVLERKVDVPGQRLDRLFRVDRQLAVLEDLRAIGVRKFAGIEHRPGSRAAHAVAVAVFPRLGEAFCDLEEVVPGPV
ncbi:MAG: hypothetical protein WBZ51_02795, partial [Xanthobacteraceae bacterium]